MSTAGIIGGGNMGAAYARCFLSQALTSPENLIIIESGSDRRAALESELRCKTSAECGAELSKCDLIFIAVKPQDMNSACSGLVSYLRPESVVVSIMAGVTLSRIEKELHGHKKLLRCMPNIAAQIGQGMTAYLPAAELTDADIESAEKFLSATGAILRVKDEQLLDAATAISGSGPGFIYYLIDNAIEECEALGFSSGHAESLVRETLEGSLALWRASGEKPASLQAKVTSKGGTTAAGIAAFAEKGLAEALSAGLRAAFNRAREISRN